MLGTHKLLCGDFYPSSLMRLVTMSIIATLAASSVGAASYQKNDGTIVEPIQTVFGGNLDYTGPNLEPYANLVPDSFSTFPDLSYANLTQANLSHANLFDSNLEGVNLTYANLTHAKLEHAHLAAADLSHADLRHADLSHGKAPNANLLEADLSEADLQDSYLLKANLTGANLSDANLEHADLTGAGPASFALTVDSRWSDTSNQLQFMLLSAPMAVMKAAAAPTAGQGLGSTR